MKFLLHLFWGLLLIPFSSGDEKSPNIILFSIDDLNDWVGCLGGHPQARTPNLDRLAAQGTLFANAHCQSPVCNPSRTSLMTGRYPHSTGVYFLSPDLKSAPTLRGVQTLPEAFAQNGYHTMAAGKLFHTGNQRFFEEYGGKMGGFGPIPKEKISQPHGHPLWDWGAYPEKNEDMPDHKVADWAIQKLEANYQKPFFLGVGFWRPHVPMFAPKKWFDLFPLHEIELPLTQKNDLNDISQYARDLTTLEHVAPTHEWIQSAGQWKHAVQSYLASIAFADHQLGRVLDALENSSHKDNTIIILFSDHGFHLGEKERWAKRSLWEEGTKVPLIISAPGFEKNRTTSQPVELLDIFPTLLELAGMPEDLSQEGQSLVPLMKNPKAEWPYPSITSFGPGNYAVRDARYRYIRYHDHSEELYDHQSDPHEFKNLLSYYRSNNAEAASSKLAKFLPKNEATLLPGKSTGHKAFQSANSLLKSP